MPLPPEHRKRKEKEKGNATTTAFNSRPLLQASEFSTEPEGRETLTTPQLQLLLLLAAPVVKAS